MKVLQPKKKESPKLFTLVPINFQTNEVMGDPISLPIDGTVITVGRNSWQSTKTNQNISREAIRIFDISDEEPNTVRLFAVKDKPTLHFIHHQEKTPMKPREIYNLTDQDIVLLGDKVTGFKIIQTNLGGGGIKKKKISKRK